MSIIYPLVGPDKVARRLAKDGAPAILHSVPKVFVTLRPVPRRIVRRADYVRKIEKRVTHREVATPHRLLPCRVDQTSDPCIGPDARHE